MPELSDISYSREATIAAIRDYYAFLVALYLPESAIKEPPPEGWPSITADRMRVAGKTDEVVALLRHVPYISEPESDSDSDRGKFQGAPGCSFADYESLVRIGPGADAIKLVTEGRDPCDDMPAHVVGLTTGGLTRGHQPESWRRDGSVFLLDTRLGIVYWVECPAEIRYDSSIEQVEDAADAYVDGPAWALADFFDQLKNEFVELNFVPLSPRCVFETYSRPYPDAVGSMETLHGDMLETVQDIYREHGWPDLEKYRKEECLLAVRKAVENQYPSYIEYL
jgi:hypothetical protein